jgi:hypothetical protein
MSIDELEQLGYELVLKLELFVMMIVANIHNRSPCQGNQRSL